MLRIHDWCSSINHHFLFVLVCRLLHYGPSIDNVPRYTFFSINYNNIERILLGFFNTNLRFIVEDLGTTPISLPIPPNSPPKEISTAQQTPLVPLPPPPPPQEIGGSLDPNTPNANSTVVEQQQQPHPSKNATSTLHVVENQNNVSSSGSQETSSFLLPHLLVFLSCLFLGFFNTLIKFALWCFDSSSICSQKICLSVTV